MVFYSTKSKEKVFHLPHCKIARRISHENKRQFSTPEEGRNAGYRMCNCCSVIGVKFRKEQKAVDEFCRKHDISCRLEDDQLHVRTPESRWRIIVSGKAKKIFLYHKNTYEKKEKIPSVVPGYHSQAIRCTTIVGYLEYIIDHDVYRRQQKKKARQKATSLRNLRRNTQPYRRGEDNRSYNANQLYSIMEDIYL